MTSLSITMNKALVAFSRELLIDTVTAIATKHGLDVDETVREFLPMEFNIETKKEVAKKEVKKEVVKKEKPAKKEKPPKTDQPAFVLPWCGEAKDCWCSALRANYGLYTQCTMSPLPGEKYCKACHKHVDAAPDGIPPCGTVEQRIAAPLLDYRDPKGKKASLYSAYMKKNNITEESVRTEAARFGFTVPDEQIHTISSGRGRPKKSTTIVDDTDSEDSKKKPGRPKKTITEEISTEQLVAHAMQLPLHINNNDSHFQQIDLTPTTDDEEEL